MPPEEWGKVSGAIGEQSERKFMVTFGKIIFKRNKNRSAVLTSNTKVRRVCLPTQAVADITIHK